MSSVITHQAIDEKLKTLATGATIRSYSSKIKAIYNQFKGKPIKPMREVFEDDEAITGWILGGGNNDSIKSLSTKKAYLCAYIFLLKEFEFDLIKRNNVKSLIKDKRIETTIKQKEDIKNTNNTLDDAKLLMSKVAGSLDAYMALVFATMGEDKIPIYNLERQWAAYLYFVLNFGVLRNSEFSSIAIWNGEGVNDKPNYINMKNGILYIGDHKNKKSVNIREIELNREFMELIKPAKYALFCANAETYKEGNKAFASSDSFKKSLFKNTGYDNYNLRKAKVSIELAKPNNIKGIQKLMNTQGHTLETQFDYYNTFSKRDDKAASEESDEEDSE